MKCSMSVTTSLGAAELSVRMFPEEGVSIRLPETMVRADEGHSPSPMAYQPQHQFIDAKNRILFMLSSSPAEDGIDLEALAAIQRQMISRVSPGYAEYGVKRKVINGNPVVCINYKSNAIDCDLYNVFYLTMHRGKAICGLFSCPLDLQVEWNLVFLMCIDTLAFDQAEPVAPNPAAP